jgi:glycosyltransferase involved in cell wall biosynthesis
MEVSEARTLRRLEEENRRLKHIVAELMLDNAALEKALEWAGSSPTPLHPAGGDHIREKKANSGSELTDPARRVASPCRHQLRPAAHDQTRLTRHPEAALLSDLPVTPATHSGPVRILLTVPHLNTASPYREMMAIARYLPRDEFALTICSLRNSGLAETQPRLAKLGVPLVVAAFRPKQRSVRGLVRSLREQTLINRLGPFDIHHSLDFTSSPFEAAVARWHGRRFIFSQRNMNVGGLPGLLRLKTLIATHAVAISAGTRHLLERHGATAARVTTIYNGIDLDGLDYRHPTRARDGNEIVLCVGQIIRLKRQADAVQAFAMLAADRPAALLRIVGPVFDHSYHDELVALARELHVSDRVEFLGERPDVPTLMRDADVLLLCSEHEAFGWVVVEAMAIGLPVVASGAEGPKEMITDADTGFLIPVGDVPGYARAICRILDNSDEAGRIAARARALVEERFQARTMVSQLAALYRRLAGSSG